VFEARIPLSSSPAVAPAAAPGSTAARPRRRVLVVEDNADIRESLRLMLRLWGHEAVLAETGTEGLVAALEWLADELGAPKSVPIPEDSARPQLASGKFNPEAFASTLAALLPENCIVAEDAVTSGRSLFAPTFNAAPCDWLQLTGGAIGHAFPCAAGAAVACRDRKVVCLQADGAGMYSLQALWTQAREKLDVLTIVLALACFALGLPSWARAVRPVYLQRGIPER